jgi:hypothetical protein
MKCFHTNITKVQILMLIGFHCIHSININQFTCVHSNEDDDNCVLTNV